MNNKNVIKVLALLSVWVLFIVINYYGVYLSLYGYIWWLDIMMHTWGGFMVVTTWYLVKSLNVFPRALNNLWLQPLVVLWVMMIVWELFEFHFGLINEFGYISDTIYDFINGFVGGLASVLIFRFSTIKR